MSDMPFFPMQYLPVATDQQIFGLPMANIVAVHQLHLAARETAGRSSIKLSEVPVIGLQSFWREPPANNTEHHAILLQASIGRLAVAVEHIYPTRTIEQDRNHQAYSDGPHHHRRTQPAARVTRLLLPVQQIEQPFLLPVVATLPG